MILEILTSKNEKNQYRNRVSGFKKPKLMMNKLRLDLLLKTLTDDYKRIKMERDLLQSSKKNTTQIMTQLIQHDSEIKETQKKFLFLKTKREETNQLLRTIKTDIKILQHQWIKRVLHKNEIILHLQIIVLKNQRNDLITILDQK